MKQQATILAGSAMIASAIFLGLWQPWDTEGVSEQVAQQTPTATLTPKPTATAPPTSTPSPIPDRNDCDEMRGTPYRSPTEREWFLAHCVTSVAPPVKNAVQPPSPLVNELVVEPDQAVDAAQQAIADQFTACWNTWGEGSLVEAGLALDRILGIDTSYSERQIEGLQEYLTSNCIGIGARLASVAGASRWCFDMLSAASLFSAEIQLATTLGAGTNFLRFGKREIDGLLAAAAC